jgi:hypothetical protein
MVNTKILEIMMGMLLRITLPIILTLGAGWVLKRLDDHWRKNSLSQRLSLRGLNGPIENLNCWDVFDCSTERRSNCRAYNNPDIPCWEAVSSGGQLQEVCRSCPLRAGKLAKTAAAV